MRIALDYDKTFTLDPDMWVEIIQLMQGNSHEVIIVTMRYLHEEIPINIKGVNVHYTERKAKVRWCMDHGIDVNVWIDDQPYWLLNDS